MFCMAKEDGYADNIGEVCAGSLKNPGHIFEYISDLPTWVGWVPDRPGDIMRSLARQIDDIINHSRVRVVGCGFVYGVG
jgi:hypothetical protein